ncbi:hypothetical protein B0T21DRAFT_375377 [Apiosordaria backusii]|uniref:Uncharacterized protein n=1 Tax=Apiosordaria backusii TaxID=314023 RepID=A0AA40DX02_9PEZI|nr:hypothetical protein B0T21DRAFT_375377 [Apiosordaria backusii]
MSNVPHNQTERKKYTAGRKIIQPTQPPSVSRSQWDSKSPISPLPQANPTPSPPAV